MFVQVGELTAGCSRTEVCRSWCSRRPGDSWSLAASRGTPPSGALQRERTRRSPLKKRRKQSHISNVKLKCVGAATVRRFCDLFGQFQVVCCEDLMIFVAECDRKKTIFGFWTLNEPNALIVMLY